MRKKITIKVNNPLNVDEYFAAIALWDRELAKNFKDKFLSIWEGSTPIRDVEYIKIED